MKGAIRLERVGFDRAVERGGAGKMLENTEYDPSDVVGKVIYYALLLIVLQLAFGVFGTNPSSANSPVSAAPTFPASNRPTCRPTDVRGDTASAVAPPGEKEPVPVSVAFWRLIAAVLAHHARSQQAVLSHSHRVQLCGG